MNRSPWRNIIRWGLAAACITGLLPARAVEAQARPTLRCVFSAPSAQAGSTVDMRIELLNADDLFGYQFELRFAAGTLQFTDLDPARAGVNLELGSLVTPDFVAQNVVNAGNGEALLAVTQMVPSPARGGSGTLARAQVQPLVPGTLNVELVNVILANSEAAAMPHDLTGCSIEVSGQALPTLTPGPTRTPAPTQLEGQPTAAPGGAATATTSPTQNQTAIFTTPDNATGAGTATATLAGTGQTSPEAVGATPTLAFNTQAAGGSTPQGTHVSAPLVSGGGATRQPAEPAEEETSGGGARAALRVVGGLVAVAALFFVLRRRALPQ